jgi:hypothetical protein
MGIWENQSVELPKIANNEGFHESISPTFYCKIDPMSSKLGQKQDKTFRRYYCNPYVEHKPRIRSTKQLKIKHSFRTSVSAFS